MSQSDGAESNPLLLVISTFPSSEVAGEVAYSLVGERLCACVNLVRGMRSIYWWKGKVEATDEVLAVIKTPSSRHAELVARLTELHPYACPEVVTVRPSDVNADYLSWVIKEASEGAASDGESPYEPPQ